MEHPITANAGPASTCSQTEGITPGLRIEQVVEGTKQSPEININSDEPGVPLSTAEKTAMIDDDEEDEPSMLDTFTSEQLARRPSFKKILEDLSAADTSLPKNTGNPELMTSAAALQAQQLQAALQQVASGGALTGTSLLPGLLQGGSSTASSNGDLLSSQLSVMLPAQQQIQLQSALLQSMNAHSSGVVQSLASQNNIPASLISSALINANVAASLSASSPAGMKVGQSVQTSIVDNSDRKRDVRLMKNREAARECRRKKKEYVRCLESRVAVLESQNQALIGELRALKELYLPKTQENN